MRIATRPLAAVLLGCALLGLPEGSVSQPRSKPFDTVRVGVNVFGSLGGGRLQAHWSIRPGIQTYAEAPFHAGMFQGGIHVNRFAGRGAGQPDFTGANIWAGYGFRTALPGGLEWMLGPHLGAFQMVFDGVTGSMKWETEIAAGARTRLSAPVTRSFSADLSVAYFRVFTSTRIDLFYPSLGISYSFSSPGWLRDFIR